MIDSVESKESEYDVEEEEEEKKSSRKYRR